eukprot:TRINITY_DN1260_c1_g1_i1.p1 TRINITY_DN1260_c1_g1~~TRINITY_DN1260_c1_g1_i1.p1  ORF type:complete len:1023 (+),score=167.65 TRINITY_DN1260_c1_g1_i1:50-3070(+)
MGCCQATAVEGGDGGAHSEAAGGETSMKEVVVGKGMGSPIGIVIDDGNIILNVGGRPSLAWCVGWEVVRVDGVVVQGQATLDEIWVRNKTKVILTVRRPARDLGSMSPVTQQFVTQLHIRKPEGQSIGLVLTTDMVILHAEGIAHRNGLAQYKGWKIVEVNGMTGEGMTPGWFGRVVREGNEVTVGVVKGEGETSSRELAWWKIRKQWGIYRERKRVDELMFPLVLRELEIQEENDLNNQATYDEESEDERLSSDDEDTAPNAPAPLQPSRLLLHLKALFQGTRPSDPDEVLSIVTHSRKKLAKLPNVANIVIPPNGQLTIVGDIHGQLEDLIIVLNGLGTPSELNQVIFNGDVVDRGRHSIECLLVILILVLLHPGCVHFNRGNHEDERVNAKYGFDQECTVEKYNLKIFKAIQKLFKSLPLLTVARQVAITHGGLPEYPSLHLSEINKLNRFRAVPRSSSKSKDSKIMQGLLWSDPRDDITTIWEKSRRGAGVYFSKHITEGFLSANNLRMLVRSHQTVDDGVKEHHNGLVRTVFSASKYRGKENNKGAVMVLRWGRDKTRVPDITVSTWDGCSKVMLPAAVSIEEDDMLTPKEEVLKRVRGLIFTRQVELLKAFQEVDQAEEGKVTKAQWVAVMRKCVECLPWVFLSRHVTSQEPDGMIAYVTFLQRYQSVIATKWIAQWCDAILPHVILRIGDCISDIESSFGSVDTDGTQKLSYHEFFLFLTHREHLTVLDPASIYYILQVVDTNRDGFVSLQEFKKTFQFKYETIKDTPADNHFILLWEAKTSDPDAYQDFQGKFRGLEEASNSKGVSIEAFIKLGLECFGGRRNGWRRTGLAVTLGDKKGLVRMKHLNRKLSELEELRNRSKLIMDVIRKLSLTKIGLRRLFVTLSGGSGKISRPQFKRGLKKYMLSHYAQADTLWRLLDTNNDGYITLTEFLSSLSVTDTWTESVSCVATKTHLGGDTPDEYFSTDSYASSDSAARRKKKKKKRSKKKRRSKKTSGEE